MPKTVPKQDKPCAIKRLSPKARSAAKALKDLTVAPTPARLRGKHTAAIKRAVRAYYVG